MNWQGKIDFAKATTLLGKPHGIEHLPTLPTWTVTDRGRTIHTEDTGRLWFGALTMWDELTPGGIAIHNHDDRYYTDAEVDNMFEGKSGQKQVVNWINISNKPLVFTPDTHGNNEHDKNYIAGDDVTYSLLNTNGLVGQGVNQVAQGNHSHTATQTSYDNTSSGLVATNLQSAIDDLDDDISIINGNVTALDTRVTTLETDVQTNTDDITQAQLDIVTLQTPVIPPTTGLPIDVPVVGTFRFDAVAKTLYIFDGSAWISTVLS